MTIPAAVPRNPTAPMPRKIAAGGGASEGDGRSGMSRVVIVDSEVVAAARALAARAHKGQRDKASRDYFDAHLVPIASAAAIFGPEVEAAAWLHDVLEDTDVSAADLLNAGMPVGVVQGVEAVTRLADETYSHLIARACLDPVGRFVKLVDNGWNVTSNPVLAKVDADRAASMLSGRYLPARQRLLHACGLQLDSPVVREMQAVLDHHHERLQRTA